MRGLRFLCLDSFQSASGNDLKGTTMKRGRLFANGLMRLTAYAQAAIGCCYRFLYTHRPIAFIMALSLQADSYGGQWFNTPEVKASMRFEVGGMRCLPHYMNKDADDKFLLVNMGATSEKQPVMLYDFQRLIDLNGTTNDEGIAIAVADPSSLFPAGLSGYGFKGGAVSSRINIAMPGLAGSEKELYYALLTTNEFWTAGRTAEWVTNETAFCVQAPSYMGADGLDFSTDGQFLYSNVYGNDERIVKWSYNSLTSTNGSNRLTAVKVAMTGLARVRNISLYRIKGRELIFFGEGSRSATSARVCVLDVTDEDAWEQHTLIDSPDLFLDDVMNVKVSGEDTDSPVLYVCTDDGRMQIFSLASNGMSLKSYTPIQTFEVAELARLRDFRNFEVSRDGQYAFFLNDSEVAADIHDLCLNVVQANPNATFNVRFDLGTHGTWRGGGTLSQLVTNTCAALPPVFTSEQGWVFVGWDRQFTSIVADTVVSAQWRQITSADIYSDWSIEEEPFVVPDLISSWDDFSRPDRWSGSRWSAGGSGFR